MLTTNKNITINGNVTIDEAQVAYINATIRSNGNIDINKSITNKEIFNTNKEEVFHDFEEFERYVYSIEESDEQTT